MIVFSQTSKKQCETLQSQLAQQQELADLKFRRLLVELRNFDTPIIEPVLAERMTPRSLTAHNQISASSTALPELHIPLGAISVLPHAASLPAVGFDLGQAPVAAQIARLTMFFVEHNHEPFARPLFLASDLTLLPLLGRYGFAFHRYHGCYENDVPYIAARYGLQQIRALDTGRVEWQRP